MVAGKIFGWFSVAFGLLIIFTFPYTRQYQPENFSHAGIVIGIFFVALGIYLIQA